MELGTSAWLFGAIGAFVSERIARALPDSFPLPLGDSRHDVQHKPSGRGASIERFGNRENLGRKCSMHLTPGVRCPQRRHIE